MCRLNVSSTKFECEYHYTRLSIWLRYLITSYSCTIRTHALVSPLIGIFKQCFKIRPSLSDILKFVRDNEFLAKMFPISHKLGTVHLKCKNVLKTNIFYSKSRYVLLK